MTRIFLSTLCIGLLLSSCKENTQNPDPTDPVLTVDEIAKKYLDAQVDIEAAEVTPDNFKTMKVTLDFEGEGSTVYNYGLDYYEDGRLKSYQELGDESTTKTYSYSDDQVSLESDNGLIKSYALDAQGLAIKANDYEGEKQYFYKNGYLVYAMLAEPSNLRVYDQNGDLTQLGDYAKYEYTDYPNTVRQEVTGPMTVHWTFRDSFLGKFSTNLLKSASFNESNSKWTLQFDYAFDEQGRVTQIVIDRLWEATNETSTITYDLSY
ncbi:hypothetical protein LAG90_07825 [Marinilongibacter aquaticus]|uniref:hypothetical protein n=1 Tax=Marinilongibacter aquaticus TaxID=2975157 RepID=UPI0021BD9F14|nr:hypothetical protein [Marinilongibacter aquaticus]UBM60548.1 hypothetical protein LAG90_07825 [Marinilongibacter aquaticus]